MNLFEPLFEDVFENDTNENNDTEYNLVSAMKDDLYLLDAWLKKLPQEEFDRIENLGQLDYLTHDIKKLHALLDDIRNVANDFKYDDYPNINNIIRWFADEMGNFVSIVDNYIQGTKEKVERITNK